MGLLEARFGLALFKQENWINSRSDSKRPLPDHLQSISSHLHQIYVTFVAKPDTRGCGGCGWGLILQPGALEGNSSDANRNQRCTALRWKIC